MDNRCPHKRASLHKGDIEDLGQHMGGLCVRCPKHRKKYGGGLYVSLNDGLCRTKRPLDDKGKEKKVKKWSVRTYNTRVDESGAVYVQMPLSDSSDSDSDSDSSCAMMNEDGGRAADSKWCDCILEDVSTRVDSAGDVFVYRFVFTSESAKALFLKVAAASGSVATAWHVWLRLENVEREYTPISDFKAVATQGSVSLLIRLYAEGEMSAKLRAARPGCAASLSVPLPTLEPKMWPPASKLENQELWNCVADGKLRLGMVCAGTGVTPCVQVLAYIVDALRSRGRAGSESRGCVCGLLSSNRRTAGALMADELRLLESRAPENTVVVRHTLTSEGSLGAEAKRSRPSPEYSPAFSGRISKDMLAAVLPGAHAGNDGSACMVVVTGPPGFAEHCVPLLTVLGYPQSMIVVLDA
eukprot:TRINITY_DN48816_c0_g1_i1.p1 TRINITY_DN48816_c0_g1~~TRINITY_DN48816_c0_g1_i1.p1  ORF type:complete len:482 (-),score=60.79 TRINITY_DN48816_c0_g1_i1:430-1665(-)